MTTPKKRIKKTIKSAKQNVPPAGSLGQYIPLVVSIARKYHNIFKNVDIEDLVAEGNRGLFEAQEHFNPAMATKFSTYAWFWITKNMQEYVTSSVSLIGIPRKTMSNLRKVLQSIESEVKKGKTPSLEDISKRVDLDLSNIRDMLVDRSNMANPLSLDGFIDSDGQDITLGDVVANDDAESLKGMVDDEERLNIAGLMDKLSKEEAEVVKWRYGFHDNRFHSLKEVAEKMHLTPGRIRDIEQSAIYRLKKLANELPE